MAAQIVVYSLATGRRRRGYYDTKVVSNVVQFLNECRISAGEGRIVYNSTGTEGTGLIAAQQAAINAVTGKNVIQGQDAGDTYAEVDAQNNILSVHCADPACGDVGPNGGTLVLAPAGCSMNWTYNGTTFSPPVFVTKV